MTKDEFILKYHKQKVLKFEPPTWEEFLATRDIDNGILAHWDCGDISIVMSEENNLKGVNHCSNIYEIFYNGEIDNWERVHYYKGDGFDNQEEMYYKALDIASKWFLE